VDRHHCLRGDKLFRCAEVPHKNVTSSGAWSLGKAAHLYKIDRGLAAGLARLFGSDSSVADFGAGIGCYVDALRVAGVRDARAFEGAQDIDKITRGAVRRADLSTELHFGRSDWVLCLEVAEHIPAEHEARFIANLDAHNTKGIVLSWSVSHGGNGHVNPRSGAYVAARMGELNYTEDVAAGLSLQRSVSTWNWFRPSSNGNGGVRVWRRISSPPSIAPRAAVSAAVGDAVAPAHIHNPWYGAANPRRTRVRGRRRHDVIRGMAQQILAAPECEVAAATTSSTPSSRMRRSRSSATA
jgi:hypothetical protein